MSRRVVFASAVLVASCSSDPAGPSTFAFPTADDSWDGDPGSIGNVSGTRSPPAAARGDVVLVLSEPAACEHSLIRAVGSNGSWQPSSIPVVVGEGEREVRYSIDSSAFSGRPITLQIQGQKSACGPLKVSLTESKVTFFP